MRIIALDDEPLALRRLSESIKEAEPDAELYLFENTADALAYTKESRPDVAFLDIRMHSESDGLDFGKALKLEYPRINIVFTSGYDDYALEAMDMNASGYILKPVTTGKVRTALDNLRYTPLQGAGKIRFQCFGNFEVFFNGVPMKFRYVKTKEFLAMLVDRRGAMVSIYDVEESLFGDTGHKEYLKSLRKDLIDTFTKYECLECLSRQHGGLGVMTESVSCDYFDWLEGEPGAIQAYRGEYMTQYKWAWDTNQILKKQSGMEA